MQDFDPIKPKIENHEKEIKQTELTFIGSLIKPFKNATLWEFHIDNQILIKADISHKIAVSEKGEPIKKQELTKNKGCVYFWALHERSARKKLKKHGLLLQNA